MGVKAVERVNSVKMKASRYMVRRNLIFRESEITESKWLEAAVIF